MLALKVTQIGSSLGIVLSPEALQHYQLKEGDMVYLNGAMNTTPLATGEASAISVDPATVEQLRAGHEFMRDYHAAFRALAK